MKFDTLATKYRGRVAREYESKRFDPKWLAEERVAAEMLQQVPRGSSALDVPVGTGRLIPLLAERGLLITGIDASRDMLEEARQCASRTGASAELTRGDIRQLSFPDNSFDVVTCLRFLNWIEMEGATNAELFDAEAGWIKRSGGIANLANRINSPGMGGDG